MKPAHGQIFVDDLDRLWVRGVFEAGGSPRWDVFAADGRYGATVAIPDPPGFIRPVLRDGRMAVITQVDDVPTVIVYDLVEVAR